MSPVVSVILPVYNGERYLREAVDSLLAQTFRDFEIIVINDASSDRSEEVIRSFNDPRIRYFHNSRNEGLISVLNKGIALSKGKYIARMDQDDISLPRRFDLQVNLLEKDSTLGLVCSPVMGITPAGRLRDHWPADIETRTHEQLRRRLPVENCIAHPTVMVRALLMRKYLYSPRQKGSEDWDLWLRMVRDGVRMQKTEQVLLHYRVHAGSSTVQSNFRKSPQLRTTAVKWRFFRSSVSNAKLNATVLSAVFSIPRDLFYYFRKELAPEWARRVRWLFTVNPFRAAADVSWLRKLKPSRHFLFFSYSHMGGAEKVHAAITQVIADAQPLVFFTGLHDRGGLADEFGNASRTRNVSAGLYHPFFSGKARILMSRMIASQAAPVLLGANSGYFYDLVPTLPGDATCVDLTHDFSYQAGVTPKRLAALLRLDHRVFVSNRALDATKKMYEQNFVDDEHYQKLTLIYNYVRLEKADKPKIWSAPFTILYVGRDSPEKRVHLVLGLAKEALQRGLPYQFVLAGDIRKREKLRNVEYYGEISDRGRLAKLYEAAHFVIITSASEGFPLSLMEGMACGCIPFATSVGDIPFHIRHRENGLLLPGGNDEIVLKASVEQLNTLHSLDLPGISAAARSYCMAAFSYETFRNAYRSVLLKK